MSNVATYADLLAEKKRLEDYLGVKKAIIRHELLQLKEELQPALNLLSTIGAIKRYSLPPLLSVGLTIVGEVLLKNRLPFAGDKLARVALPFIAEKLSALVFRKSRNASSQKPG